MYIDYLEMKNYRQYANTKIEFAQSVPRNFNILLGPNGAGKTNILNAITWCLFGKELHIDKKYEGLPIVNTTILDNSKEGDILEVKVEIQFVESSGKKLKVSRALYLKKEKENFTEISSLQLQPCLMRQTEREWIGPITGGDAQYIINSHIPQSIEEYFFFDGERMNDYFRENTGNDIRKAVFKISQLELFETLIEHLGSRRHELLKEAKGLSPKVQKLKDDLEVINRSLEHDKKELEKLQEDKNTAERMVLMYSEMLRDSSPEHIQNLEVQREELSNNISSIQSQIEDIETDELKALHHYMPAIFTHDALDKTVESIEMTRAAGKIPPLYEEIFITNLLKKGKCICGSDITEKNEYSKDRRKKVETYLEISKLSNISSDLIETNALIKEMLSELTGFKDETISYGKRLRILQREKTDKTEAIKKIAQEIEQSNAEEIRQWENKRSEYEKEKNNLIGKIAVIEDHNQRRENQIKFIKKGINSELKKEKKHASLLKKFNFCDDGIKAAQEVKESIMKEVKDDVERRTSKQFLALIWKKGTFKGVTIDDDYNISVPHVSGRESLGTLSAGERQVCALSFMAALNSVSGFAVPIVIDTPLARISSEPRKSIAQNLPNYLEGTQVTLLVTEEEYTSEVSEALSDRVGKIYKIDVLEQDRGNLAEVKLIR